MSYANYCELIDGLCDVIGVTNPENLYERADLMVDDEECAIAHGGQYNEDRLAVYCVCGEVPEHQADLALQRLLEANFTIMAPGELRYALNPKSNEVVLTGMLSISDLSPEGLLQLLSNLADQARKWRRHYFLDAVEEFETCSASPLSSSAKTRRLS